MRHAESVENDKLGALQKAAAAVRGFRLPAWADIGKGASLLAHSDVTNTPLSDLGRAQVEHIRDKLREHAFFETNKIDLVLHSPLDRARDTCRGLLEAFHTSEKPPVEVWECLREKYVFEWIPGNGGGLDKRIKAFESYIQSRPEQNIVRSLCAPDSESSCLVLFGDVVRGRPLSIFQKDAQNGGKVLEY